MIGKIKNQYQIDDTRHRNSKNFIVNFWAALLL